MKKVTKIAVMMTCLMAGCDETTRMKEENYTEKHQDADIGYVWAP